MAHDRTFSVGGPAGEADSVPVVSPFGRGRGVLNHTLYASPPGLRGNVPDSPFLSSTRYVDRAMPSNADQNPDMRSLITQLAEKLGQSITAQLQSDRNVHSVEAPVQSSDTSLPSLVVVKSDIKEPPVFRGDDSDKFTVHEWETVMNLYLRKRDISVHEQSMEIQARLMGKARDVVRIKLRNDTSIDHASKPHVIFDILKQHFSPVSYSNMPLADFYNTLPIPGEEAMEYWIRLNNTVDVAVEGLARQGRTLDDPGHEVSMMFVKHCPDPSLCHVFKFKSAEKWSACEIQERLDEHMQERKTRVAFVKSFDSNVPPRKVHSQSHVPAVDDTIPRSTSVPSVIPQPSPVAPVDNDCMRSLVSLLDRLVTQQTQSAAATCNPTTAPHSYQKVCRVCGGSDHSTLSHCKREHRCLRCLVPGHWKRDCPQGTKHRRFQPTASSDVQNPPLN